MNLGQIITGATAGFSIGFIASREKAKHDKTLSRLQYLKQFNSDLLKDDSVERIRAHNRILPAILPYAFGGVYSMLSTIVSLGDYSFNQNILIAVPSAYIGYIADYKFRLKNKKEIIKELQIAQQIKDNPDSIESILDDDVKLAVNNLLGQIESKVLEGKGNEINEDSLKRVFNIVKEKNHVYNHLIFNWLPEEIKKTVENSRLQIQVRGFYENWLSIPAVTFGTIGTPVGLKSRIYGKQGDRFYIHEVICDQAEIIERDFKDIKEVNASFKDPGVTTLREEPWTGNYKDIAKMICESPNFTNVLMLSPGKIPDKLAGILATQTIIRKLYQPKSEGKK